MNKVITHSMRNLTKNFNFSQLPQPLKVVAFIVCIMTTTCATSCLSEKNSKANLVFPSGNKLELEFALTEKEQAQGLSHRTKEDFPKNRGMLFVYENKGVRQFWMPETHFDLAIAFLDENFKVLAVENPVPHHPSKKEPIPRTGSYYAQHVLEVRSDSQFADELKVGTKLKWKGPKSHLKK